MIDGPFGAAAPVATGIGTSLAAADPELEAALRVLRRPAAKLGSGLVLVASLALFLLVQARSTNAPQAIAILVGTLILHELGHFAGMRLFGYRDVKMFFIPFFGAAVSGKRAGAAAWKEGVVLLLGPVPGILLAMVLALRGTALSPVAREAAVSLLSINAFNLLPLSGLDGARLWQHVLFSRQRWLEVGFQLCAALAAAAVAVRLQSWGLGILAYLMLAVLPFRWKILGAARQLRMTAIALPTDARDLDGEAARAVFQRARDCLSNRKAQTVAGAMIQIVDAANLRTPSILASLVLGAAWVIALVLALVTLVLLFAPARAVAPALPPGAAFAPAPYALPPLRKPRLLDDTPTRAPAAAETPSP